MTTVNNATNINKPRTATNLDIPLNDAQQAQVDAFQKLRRSIYAERAGIITALRNDALNRVCPTCHADKGQPCLSLRAHNGPNKFNKHPHEQRLEDMADISDPVLRARSQDYLNARIVLDNNYNQALAQGLNLRTGTLINLLHE